MNKGEVTIRRYLVFALAVILAAAVIIGCSSGKKGTSPGPTGQQTFEALKPSIEGIIADLFDFLDLGLGFQGGVDSGSLFLPGLGRIVNDGDSIISFDYSYADGWHHVEFGIDLDSVVLEMDIVVQFTGGNGEPQQDPDETTASLQVILDFDFSASTYEINGELNERIDLTYTGLQTSIITVTGDGEFDIDASGHDGSGPYDVDLEFAIGIDEVTITNPQQGGDGCPASGEIVLRLDGTYSGLDEEGHQVAGSVDATVTVTFNANRTAVVVFTIGASQFSETVSTCGAT